MIRSLLRSAIAEATVTAAADAGSAALRLDAFILHAAELLPAEEVEVVNLATGARFRTYVEAAPGGSGEVAVAGVRVGDRVVVLSFALLHEGQTLAHRPKRVTLDAANRVTAISE
jgi:aspartate 1-decarboxylase